MKRIMLVEDDEDLSFALMKMLEDEGIFVLTAGSAEEAFEILQNQRFDLVITDLLLPGMDGAELCRMIRKDSREAQLPLVLLTSMPSKMGLVLGDVDVSWAPADRYVDKSASLEEILDTIREFLA